MKNLQKLFFSVLSIILLSNFISAGTIEGEWEGEVYDEFVIIKFDIERDRGEWHTSKKFNKSELSGLQFGQDHTFTFTEDAGVIEFTGKFTGDEGKGEFVFRTNDEFERFLAREGFDSLDEEELFHLLIAGVDKKYLQDLKRLGYGDISDSKLISFAIHGVKIKFIEDLQALGYDDLSASKLISFRIHGVSPEYVGELKSIGYKDVSPSDLISLKIHSASINYIKDMN